MAIIDKFCPKCMNIIKKKDERCSNCGMLVSDIKKQRLKKEKEKIEKEEKKLNEEFSQNIDEEIKKESIKEPIVKEMPDGGAVVDTSVMFSSDNEANKKEELATDNIKEEVTGAVEFEQKTEPKRHKHKKKKNSNKPEYTVDEDGSYNIDTSDVTFLENIEKQTSSVRKARGDSQVLEKIEWWEIYKWADRMLARRKISKEVKKAATKTPKGIKRGAMIALCIFFGWMGAHNFYAGNKKKGWTVLAFNVIVTTVVSVPILYEIMGIFVGGGLAFTIFALWITDLFGLIFNKFRYRISKEEFISNLNVETRAKLSKKYINLDKTVFNEKEYNRLNKKKLKKERKLEKQKLKLEKNQEKAKEKNKKATKKQQIDDYEIVEHNMD